MVQAIGLARSSAAGFEASIAPTVAYRREEVVMSVRQHLLDVHSQIRTDDKVMAEARRRRDRTLALASGYDGVRFSFVSGSVAMGVVIDPVNDADGGIVLDRRVYSKLGPDGDGELPAEVVDGVHDFVGPLIRREWPKATIHTMRRGLTVKFHDPILEQDPYVDLVVAMERRDASGLWIPNILDERWDPSDPQKHVALMASGTSELRTLRARVVRLAKAWNKQYDEPALCSFNIVALALEAFDVDEPLDDALLHFFDHAIASLREGCTEDTARVSDRIKLPLGKATAIARLTSARDNIARAQLTSDEECLAAMHDVFWKYLPEPQAGGSKRDLATVLRSGSPRISTVGTTAIVGAGKRTRAYGANNA